MPRKKAPPEKSTEKTPRAAKKGTPRSTDAVVEERVTLVLQMLLRGMGPTAIWEVSKSKDFKWGVTKRTIDNYIAKANEHIRASEAVDRDLEIKKLKLQLEELHGLGVAAGGPGYFAALGAINAKIKLLGLNPPTKTELTGKDGGPIETSGPQVVIYLPDNGRGDRDS